MRQYVIQPAHSLRVSKKFLRCCFKMRYCFSEGRMNVFWHESCFIIFETSHASEIGQM